MTSTRVDLPPEDVVGLVDDITGAFLATPTVEAPIAPQADLSVVAYVHVTGAFDGSVIASVSDGFASFCAARMLAMEESELDEESKADAVGEMINMIGGSVKALLPEPSSLSLPVVSLGRRRPEQLPDTEPLASVDLSCGDQPIRVTVVTRDA